MPTHRWTAEMPDPIGYQINKIKYLNRQSALGQINRRRYFEGFKVGREKAMFEEELKDLEDKYRKELNELKRAKDECLPPLLYYMEQFLVINRKIEVADEKLDTLMEKKRRKTEEEGDDDE